MIEEPNANYSNLRDTPPQIQRCSGLGINTIPNPFVYRKHKMSTKYDASSITWLKGLEGVRAKPAMYIGETDTHGVTHLFKEIVGNAIDESVNGHGTQVGIDITDQTVTVFDNGRGIPTGKHPKHKNIDTLTILATELHAGGKLSVNDTNYQSSTGTHGQGLSIVNALSVKLTIWSISAATHTGVKKQTFEKGKPVSEVETVDFKDVPKCNGKPWHKKGTVVQYTWDKSVFDKGSKLDTKAILSYIRDISFFNFQFNSKNKTPITFMINIQNKYVEITRKSIKSFIPFAIKRLALKKEPTIIEGSLFGEYGNQLDLVMCWSDMIDPHFYSAVNSLPTSQGGTHLKGVLKGIEDSFKTFAGKKVEFRQQDIMAGVIGCCNVRVKSPRFDSQSKARLTTIEVTDIAYKETVALVTKWIKANKDIAKQIVDRAVAINKATNDSKLTKQLAAALNTKKGGKSLLPPNLVQSTAKNPEDRHLFIVEGDSAGGCFVGETLVKMSNGETYSFEQLTKMKKDGTLTGLKTIGYDVDASKFIETEITDAFVTKHTTFLVRVYLDDGYAYLCTPDHPWLTDEGLSYTPAEKLQDEYLVSDNLGSVKVIRVEHIYLSSPIPVYDITVPATQNFQLSNGCIVHNTGRKASNRLYQEVLPLRGKILNVNKAEDSKMTGSSAVISLLQSIGYDPKNPKGKLRVGQIYVLSDADPDGPLAGDTLVKCLIEKVEQVKTIEELALIQQQTNVSIMVQSSVYDLSSKTSMNYYSLAENISVRLYSKEEIKITTKSGAVIKCEPSHKFCVPKFTGTIAEHNKQTNFYHVVVTELKVGNFLFNTLKNKPDEIISIERTQLENLTPYYCMTVPVWANFATVSENGEEILNSNCHINSLVLSVLWKTIPHAFDEERINVIEAPLFVYSTPKQKIYGNTLADLMEKVGNNFDSKNVTRLKGYGEANPDELRSIAFDEKTRKAIKVTSPMMQSSVNDIMGDDTTIRKELLGLD
jgi:DNA gyrase subunit B